MRLVPKDDVVYLVTESECLRIARNLETPDLCLVETPTTLGRGLEIVCVFGFLKLKVGLYLIVVTEAYPVGVLGLKRKVYSVGRTQYIPLGKGSREDDKLLELLAVHGVDKDCYFCLDEDLSRLFLSEGKSTRNRFIWNWTHSKLLRLNPAIRNRFFVPIVNGYYEQIMLDQGGQRIQLSIFARRSRHYAGTRYLKRGMNRNGDVANEVEVEQLVTSSYGASSFVQLRGSVPLFWKQEMHALIPKPPIEFYRPDVLWQTAQKHFEDLTARYGGPIVVINSLRSAEDTTSMERELTERYVEAIQGVRLPTDIEYHSLDLKDIVSKSTDDSGDQKIAKACKAYVRKVGITVRGAGRQTGIVRTNCLDCLDRTNMLQTRLAVHALEAQIKALLLPEKDVVLAAAIREICTDIYERLGDVIALQYAGSVAHKKYSEDTKRSKELLVAITRHYSNSFSDQDKQHALNVFFGVYGGEIAQAFSGDAFFHTQTTVDAEECQLSFHPISGYSALIPGLSFSRVDAVFRRRPSSPKQFESSDQSEANPQVDLLSPFVWDESYVEDSDEIYTKQSWLWSS